MNTEKIDRYIKLLLEWNNKINLIGKSTIDDIYNRHIKDSTQLLKFFTEEEINKKTFADLGTGAGIPGIILSLSGIKNITLIEKSIQKCNFLREASKLSDNNIRILNKDIYKIKTLKFDIIVSRALANLTELLDMSIGLVKPTSKCYFLKGRKYLEELEEAKKHYNFNVEIFNSETSDEGKVLLITNIKKIIK